jgi:hypothetical protein
MRMRVQSGDKTEMKPVSILVDSFADDGLTNAQMINAREIVKGTP